MVSSCEGAPSRALIWLAAVAVAAVACSSAGATGQVRGEQPAAAAAQPAAPTATTAPAASGEAPRPPAPPATRTPTPVPAVAGGGPIPPTARVQQTAAQAASAVSLQQLSTVPAVAVGGPVPPAARVQQIAALSGPAVSQQQLLTAARPAADVAVRPAAGLAVRSVADLAAWPVPDLASRPNSPPRRTAADLGLVFSIDGLSGWVFESGVLRPGAADAVWRWHRLVGEHFPPKQWATALCVISWESSGRPSATYANPGDPVDDGIDSVGLFQIDWDNLAGANRVAGLRSWGPHNRAEAEARLLDPGTNVRAAADMVAASGWLPAWQAQARRCSLTD